MSWFDKVGESFNWLKDTAAPAIGGALSAAQHWVDSNPVTSTIDNAINPVHALVTNQIAAPVVSQGAGAIGSAYSYGLARPLSTFTQQVESASQPGSSTSLLWNTDDWRKAWNASADVSPGQALVIGSGLAPKGLNYDMTPDAMQAREQFFHNTWQGQVSSGAMDLALNLGADPTLLGAKAIKGAALARNTFKDTAERDLTLDVNAGKVAAPSARIGNLSGRMDKFFGQLDGKSSAEIALHPVVKASDQSGAFAYMFGRINQEFTDEAARRAAQRNVFGAMLGNGDSITALKDQHALLANELQRLSDTPVTTQAVGNFTWDDHGQGMLAVANQAEPAEITAQKDAIEAELARLETVTSATGTVNRLAGSLKEQHQYGQQLQGLRQTTLNTGLGNMPVRVIGGAIANRLPGQIAIKDPVTGYTDLENTLRQSRWIPGDQRRQLLDNYVNAATDGDRQKAVYDAEGAIVQSTAAQYGLTPQQARKLAEAGNGRRAAVMSTLSSRLYSAAPDDKFVPFVDAEAGEIVAHSKPILQSQIEDHLPIIDPRELDKALKGATGSRLWERVAGQMGNVTVDPSGVASKTFASSAYDIAGSAQMVASDALTKVTRVWKDSALMRLAYPARVQIDSQMRLMTHMGAMSYLSTVPSAFKGEARYLLSKQGGDKLSLTNLFKPGDYEKSIGDILTKAGIHPDDVPTITRNLAESNGGMADLAGEMSNAQLARFRATGEWGYVDPANPGWAAAWQRAVNRQIRNSPTAMKAVEGATPDELKAFVQANPAARKEWLNLKASNGDDMDGWLSSVQAHVDHYLPTAEMKETVGGKVTDAAWPGGPSVFHGTGDRFANDTPSPIPAATGPESAFLGHGFYTTGKRGYAEDYARARQGASPTVYNVKWAGANPPRVIDLATSKTPDLRSYVSGFLDKHEDPELRTVLGEDPSDEELLYQFSSYLGESKFTKDQAVRTLGEVNHLLRTHGDVLKASNGQHVFLSPGDIKTVPVGGTHVPDGLPGREVTQADMENWFADQSSRMRVHGESYSPTLKSPLADWYEGKRNGWYQFAAEAPETVMAKAPLFAHAFKRNMGDIVARHGGEDAIDAETMDNIRRSSMNLARREVGKILYDTSHSSNLSQSMRYISPFFGAWEDMVKKWGGLFYDKPWAPVRFDQAWNAPNNAGIVVDENGNRVDAQGNRFDPHTGRQLDPVKDKYLIGKRELVTIPSAILPSALKNAVGADSLRIDKNSFNIVFQGDPWWLPGAGPIVQVPVNQMVKNYFPEAATNPVIAAALPMGVSDNPVQDQFLPSWIRQAHNAFGNTQDHANVQAMLLAQETARVQNGERGPIKAGEISQMTRNWFILRAVTANASPVSLAPTPKAQFYIDQAHIYRQQYGQDWQEKFYKDFPQWYDLSLSLSNNDTGIVATLNAVDAAKKYRSLIADKPEYGWAVVGPENQYGNTPGSAFNQAAYAWQEQPIGYGQQAQFRGKSSPQEALAKVESSKGWMQYQGAMTQLNLILESRGLHSFQQKGAEDLAAWKSQFEKALGDENASWRQDFLTTNSGKVVNFLDWARRAQATSPELAKRTDMQALNQYSQAREAVNRILAQRKTSNLDDASNADVKAVWGQITSTLIQGNVGFEQMWNRLLQHDKPGQDLMTNSPTLGG